MSCYHIFHNLQIVPQIFLSISKYPSYYAIDDRRQNYLKFKDTHHLILSFLLLSFSSVLKAHFIIFKARTLYLYA